MILSYIGNTTLAIGLCLSLQLARAEDYHFASLDNTIKLTVSQVTLSNRLTSFISNITIVGTTDNGVACDVILGMPHRLFSGVSINFASFGFKHKTSQISGTIQTAYSMFNSAITIDQPFSSSNGCNIPQATSVELFPNQTETELTTYELTSIGSN
jgi:hypothetical protein